MAARKQIIRFWRKSAVILAVRQLSGGTISADRQDAGLAVQQPGGSY
jgi:hypothetical protein